ncbi:MAG: 2-C-methyl-D-erythritol 2,4-cyclodiphosphate synthase [Nitrospirae bacterium]|nr:2-C-methyl-D-erythritol 2,4-cyclodiphosphate synthase [Nitrospirota bacterium]
MPSSLRIGLGFDVHPFVSGRPLKLGGVAIPHPVGLAGHSDLDLLRQVRERLARKGARIVNVDAVVIAEAPRIAPYVDMMRARIGEALGVSADAVSVEGTTGGRLGVAGGGEGIAAQAVCLVALPVSA